MNDFHANNTVYVLDDKIRDNVRPGWQEMLLPAKDRLGKGITVTGASKAVRKAENIIFDLGNTLVGKNILEVGCNEGVRSYLMAQFQDTYVHGIDINEYTVEQSPDMNGWNPNDVKFVEDKLAEMRRNLALKVPENVAKKVTFGTADICNFNSETLYDIVISWDVIEHILDIPSAFKNINKALKNGGITYHEYNPFFAVNGGHSLCTLDFLYGHCRLTTEDFERYIREIRPEEEKIDLNFYHKCLNRLSIADFKKHAQEAGFDIIYFKETPAFTGAHAMWRERIDKEFLPETKSIYPTVTNDDLFYGTIDVVMRKL